MYSVFSQLIFSPFSSSTSLILLPLLHLALHTEQGHLQIAIHMVCVPTFDADTSSSMMNSNGSMQALELNQLLCQSIRWCHNVFSLSSDHTDPWRVLCRHTAPVFISFSTTTKASPVVGPYSVVRLFQINKHHNVDFSFLFVLFLQYAQGNIGSVVDLPFLNPN